MKLRDLPALRRRAFTWLALLLFPFYSYPLWSGARLHRSITEQDRLHHSEVLLLLRGESRGFLKYGVGAHLLDWPAVHLAYLATEPKPALRDWRTVTPLDNSELIFHYENRTGRLSAWYHALLAALAAATLGVLLAPYLGRLAAWLTALVCGLHPAWVRYAINAGTNIPLVFFALLSLLAMDRWRNRESFWWAALAGMAAAAAFVNKEYFAFCLLPLPLLLWETARAQGEPLWRSRTMATAAVFVAAFALTVAAVSLLWYDPVLFIDHLRSYFVGAGTKRVGFWQSQQTSWLAYPFLAVRGIWLTADATPLALLTLFGLYFVFGRRAQRIWVVALPAAVYLFAIPVRYQHLGFPYLFLCLPLVGAAAARGARWLAASERWYVRASGIALATAALLQFAATDTLMFRDMGDDVRRRAEDYFGRMTCPPGYSVGAFEPGAYGVGRLGCGTVTNLNLEAVANGQRSADHPDFLIVSGEQLQFLRARIPSLAKAPLDQVPRYLLAHDDYELFHSFQNRRRWLVYQLNGFNDPYYLYRRRPAVR